MHSDSKLMMWATNPESFEEACLQFYIMDKLFFMAHTQKL